MSIASFYRPCFHDKKNEAANNYQEYKNHQSDMP
jgi:hypothetical protein